MPSLIGTDIAKNYRKEQVPYSRFGTRKVVWFSIGRVDTRDGGWNLDNFEMNKLIDCIQTRAEIAIVGAPRLGNDYGRFTVGIFEDTFNNGNNTDPAGYYTDNNMATTLQTVLEDATDGDVDVHQVWLYGGEHGDGENDNGFNSSDTYQEYGTKAEYEAESYLNPGAN
jgi:hypothetical protein